jgi:hypothetical protein
VRLLFFCACVCGVVCGWGLPCVAVSIVALLVSLCGSVLAELEPRRIALVCLTIWTLKTMDWRGVERVDVLFLGFLFQVCSVANMCSVPDRAVSCFNLRVPA